MVKNYWKSTTWAVIIFILSSLPGSDINKMNFLHIENLDKIVHFGLYFILGWLFLFDLHKGQTISGINTRDVLIILGVVLYGFLIEILQKYLFIERSFEINDFIANTLGCVASVPVYIFTIKFFQRFL